MPEPLLIRLMLNLMAAVNDLEHIGDVIEVNLVELGEQRIKQGFKISKATEKVINTVHVVVSDALKAAARAVVDEDKDRIHYSTLDVRCSFVSRPIKLATAETSGGAEPLNLCFPLNIFDGQDSDQPIILQHRNMAEAMFRHQG